MLVCKGSSVRFVMTDGRSVRAAGGMLHDPYGKHWPRCSVLVGPYKKGSAPYQDLATRQYFGAGYQATLGQANVPDDRDLSAWKLVGECRQIYYVRSGAVYGGQLFQHPFKKPCKVYKKGAWYRLELGNFCNLGPRGFVSP